MADWKQAGGWAGQLPATGSSEAGIYAIITAVADADAPRSAADLSVRFNTQADGLGDDYSIDSLTWTAVDPSGEDASAAIDDDTAASTTIDEWTSHVPGQWSASVVAVIGGVTQPAVEVSWTVGVDGWFIVTPSDWTREDGSGGDVVDDNGDGTFTVSSGSSAGSSFDQAPWWIGPAALNDHRYQFWFGFEGGNVGGNTSIGMGLCDTDHAGGNEMLGALVRNNGQATLRDFTAYQGVILNDANVDAVEFGVTANSTDGIRAPTMVGINNAGWTTDEAGAVDYSVAVDGTRKLFLSIGPSGSPGSPETTTPVFRWRAAPVPDLTP